MFSFLRKKRAHCETGWAACSGAPDMMGEEGDGEHPGDEWEEAKRTEEIFSRFVVPNIGPQGAILEIGCGGGKYSEKLAALGGSLVCADASSKMLARTRARLDGKKAVTFQRISGYGLHEFETGVFDFVFSLDAFTRSSMEEIYSYLGEVRRVLKPGGKGLIRFANLSSPEGWQRFVEVAPFCRGRNDPGVRSGCLTWEIVELFMASLGFEILDRCKDPWHDILVLFRKPA